MSAGDRDLLERLVEGMGDYNRIVCASAPRARLLELEGVVAAVMPAMRERSALNTVSYQRVSALAAALDELAACYEEAGVNAWMVWVPAVDAQARELLERAGHRLDPSTTAMARGLHDFERPAELALSEWTAQGDPKLMAGIADRAFGFGTTFTRTFSGSLPARARVYIASLDGEPVSCLMAHDHGENCAVDLVATVPEAQRRGLSSALLAQALADAAGRGCTTSTLAATPRGRPVYERLGYRALCGLDQWERQTR